VLLIDGYVITLAILVVLAIAALIWWPLRIRRLDKQLVEISRRVQLLCEKSEQSHSSSSNRADALICRQHEQLVQHILSLTGGPGNDSENSEGASTKDAVPAEAVEEVAEVVARKIIEELNKKW